MKMKLFLSPVALATTVVFMNGCQPRKFNQSRSRSASTSTSPLTPIADTLLTPISTGDVWTPLVELRDKSTPSLNPALRSPAPEGWYVAPIHAVMRADGKVVITGWLRVDANRNDGGCQQESGKVADGLRRQGVTFTIDPTEVEATASTTRVLEIHPISENPKDSADVLYCSGHAGLPDGSVLYAGGATYKNLGLLGAEEEFGLSYARIYNPDTQKFSQVPFPMFETSGGKEGTAWYPTTTKLNDGRVLLTGGYFRCCQGDNRNNGISVFDPKDWSQGKNPWKTLVKHENGSDEMGPGLRDYSHNFLLPKPIFMGGYNRQVIGMGWRGKFFVISTDPNVPEKERIMEHPQGSRPNGETHGWNSTSVMLDSGEIMTFGGTHDSDTASRVDIFNPYSGQWRTSNSGISRNNASSILLPDGTVLLLAGETEGNPSFAGSRRQPQIFDPRAGSVPVTTYAPWKDDTQTSGQDPWERGYHNFSVLLKDGRVLMGGGLSKLGQIGCERPNLRIYSPAYLSRGPRPEWNGSAGSSAPSLTWKVGAAPVSLAFDPKIALDKNQPAALMALGSFTHSFDQNGRRVSIKAVVNSAMGQITLTPPTTGFEAPPGDYFLFLLSDKGVPSVARSVRIEAL